jgi:hypothetical protein
MNRPLIIRRLAIAVAGVGMLAGAALGMAEGPTTPPSRVALPQDASPGGHTHGDAAASKVARITAGFEELRPAKPMSPEEIDPYRVTRYALDNGAIAETFDPETGVLSVLFPLGSDPPPPPVTGLNVSVRTAALPNPAYDAAAEDLRALAMSPEGGKYTYGFSIDAASGLIAVDTDAPAEATAALESRHPGIFRFTRGEGLRLLEDATPAR